MNAFPRVTAHTGCMNHAAHSLESLTSALKLGVDIYEDDIRITGDGVLVLAHDDEAELFGGRRGSLANMGIEELEADSTVPILKLADVLIWVRTAGKMMNLDIKTDAALKPVFALVEQLKMEERVFLSGCGYERALKAHRISPQLQKLLNVNVDSFRSLNYEEAAALACREARASGCFGLNVPYQIVQPKLLETVRNEHLDLYVWTVEEAEDMRQLARWGVHSITTHDPAKLIGIRGESEFAKENAEWTTS